MSESTYNNAWVISMMPEDLRVEVREALGQLAKFGDHPASKKETLEWWAGRSDADFEDLANEMMQDEPMWDAWRRNFYESMHVIKQRIQSESSDLA